MKMFKRVLAAGAALMMAVTGMTMGASADDYTKTLIPLFYAPYSPSIHTFDNVSVRLRVTNGTITFNTSTSITGSGQLDVNALYATNSPLTIYNSGNYQMFFTGRKAGEWETVYYSLSNYGNYSSINVSGNVSN